MSPVLRSADRLNAGSSTLIVVTTCSRPGQVRSYLPPIARCARELGDADVVLAVDGLSEIGNPQSLDAALSCGVRCVVADDAEGVGISKNRVMSLLGGYDFYFFLDDDVELRACRIFSEHVRLHRETGIHHFSLHHPGRLRDELSPTVVDGGGVLRHAMFGGAQFNFFSRTALQRVGGWHPRFAAIRRGGHTEHSYRIYRSGLCPAPFNFVDGLAKCCRWNEPPSVVRHRGLEVAADQLYELENELIAAHIESMPFSTGSAPRLVAP